MATIMKDSDFKLHVEQKIRQERNTINIKLKKLLPRIVVRDESPSKNNTTFDASNNRIGLHNTALNTPIFNN
jgi:hypothetical protein